MAQEYQCILVYISVFETENIETQLWNPQCQYMIEILKNLTQIENNLKIDNID